MKRADLRELQCIQPIANLLSIAELGILCRNLAAGVEHEDVSDHTIQDRRHGRMVPHESGKGRELHDYANVYVCARNPMMYVRRTQHTRLSVLRVSCDVLDVPGAIVADGNASSDYTRFLSSPEGLSAINEEIAFLGDPRHPDQVERWRRTREQCAEVLVPERISPGYIEGVYVSCETARNEVDALGLAWDTAVDARMFFQ